MLLTSNFRPFDLFILLFLRYKLPVHSSCATYNFYQRCSLKMSLRILSQVPEMLCFECKQRNQILLSCCLKPILLLILHSRVCLKRIAPQRILSTTPLKSNSYKKSPDRQCWFPLQIFTEEDSGCCMTKRRLVLTTCHLFWLPFL